MKAEGRPEEAMQQEHIQHLMTMDDEEFIYKLVGVIIHRGTAEHGHYYSLINTKRGSDELDETKPEWMQTERDPWKEFNDETVKFFSFSDLKQESFGGST
jgi:ubiquitin C-terminal hydrolase